MTVGEFSRDSSIPISIRMFLCRRLPPDVQIFAYCQSKGFEDGGKSSGRKEEAADPVPVVREFDFSRSLSDDEVKTKKASADESSKSGKSAPPCNRPFLHRPPVSLTAKLQRQLEEESETVQQDVKLFEAEDFYPNLVAEVCAGKKGIRSSDSFGAMLSRTSIREGVEWELKSISTQGNMCEMRVVICIGEQAELGFLSSNADRGREGYHALGR
ncbi:hypothetical protein JCM11641_005885 [Rhodosporidiobolus odoratus]